MPKQSGAIPQILELGSTPSGNPPAGALFLYFKAGVLYQKTSAGVETAVDTGGSGGGAAVQTSAPSSPPTGSFWYDTDEVAGEVLGLQPLDSDLTAIAALTTTSYGRAVLELANQAALMALLSSASESAEGKIEIATQAETNTGTDDARAITALKLQTRLAAYAQPLDSDLTAIAALTTTSYGRGLLALADQAALVALVPQMTQAEAEAGTATAFQLTTPARIKQAIDYNVKPFQVKAVGIAQTTLSGGQTLDGISCTAGDVVLLIAQTAPAENGVWIVSAGSWSRHPAYDTATEISGAVVRAAQGTTHGGHVHTCSFRSTDTVGTTAQVWAEAYSDINPPMTLMHTETTAPSTPASGFGVTFARSSDSLLYFKNDAGAEYLLAHSVEVHTFSVTGALTTQTGKSRIYLEGNYVVETVRASVNTAPTGATILVDVNKNGTTIYTTQSARPTIAISGFTATGNSPAVTTFAAGDYITVDVDQIGSTIAGSDLTVTIRLRKVA